MIRRIPLIVSAAAIAALGLGAAPALAGVTPGGGYTPPPTYGHHPKPATHCEFIVLTGSAKDFDQLQGNPKPEPVWTPSYGQPSGYGQPGEHQQQAELVTAEQVVKVCETGEHLTVVDVTAPFAQETEGQGYDQGGYGAPAPTPSGLPAPIQSYVQGG
jgi:hypothetical protein